jgi:hypothetical protein
MELIVANAKVLAAAFVNVVVIVVVFLIKILYMPHMELLLVGDLAIMLEEFIAVLYVVLNGNFSEKWMILDI